jgi:vacuolar-type H+-ATPase subunit C/Vma6
MSSDYVYSGTYTNVLTARLFTSAHRELLLGSKSIAEVRKILQDTTISPFLTEGVDLRTSLHSFEVAQKKLLERLAPDPKLLQLLFLRYDYYNVKQVLIGKNIGLTDEDILTRCISLGNIEPAKLLQLITDNTLRFDYPHLAAVVSEFEKKKQINSLSEYVETGYLKNLSLLAHSYPADSFIRRYVTLEIDLYNIVMRLRVLTHPTTTHVAITGSHVAGGSFESYDLATLELTLKRLGQYGSQTLWREAVELFTKSKDFTVLDRTIDNYRTAWLKRESIEIHSPVSLFVYFETVLEHVRFIEAIITAHNTGLDSLTLRSLLRNSIHSYAF